MQLLLGVIIFLPKSVIWFFFLGHFVIEVK